MSNWQCPTRVLEDKMKSPSNVDLEHWNIWEQIHVTDVCAQELQRIMQSSNYHNPENKISETSFKVEVLVKNYLPCFRHL